MSIKKALKDAAAAGKLTKDTGAAAAKADVAAARLTRLRNIAKDKAMIDALSKEQAAKIAATGKFGKVPISQILKAALNNKRVLVLGGAGLAAGTTVTLSGFLLWNLWAAADNVANSQVFAAKDSIKQYEEKVDAGTVTDADYEQLIEDLDLANEFINGAEEYGGLVNEIPGVNLLGQQFIRSIESSRESFDVASRFYYANPYRSQASPLDKAVTFQEANRDAQRQLEDPINKTEEFVDRDTFLQSLVAKGVNVSDISALERYLQDNPADKRTLENLDLAVERKKIEAKAALEEGAPVELAKEGTSTTEEMVSSGLINNVPKDDTSDLIGGSSPLIPSGEKLSSQLQVPLKTGVIKGFKTRQLPEPEARLPIKAIGGGTFADIFIDEQTANFITGTFETPEQRKQKLLRQQSGDSL